MSAKTAFKIGDGNEVLTILFTPEAAKDFISNFNLFRSRGTAGDFYISVVGSLVSLD